MKAVVQRVSEAGVQFRNEKRDITKGIVVFLGIGRDDTEKDVEYMAEKIANLRIFEKEGKMSLSLKDIEGESLVISQFTLYGDCSKGRRPDFTLAEEPARAKELYERFINILEEKGIAVKKGEFGENMLVRIYNDGPVTILLENKK